MPSKNCPSPFASIRIKSLATAVADLHHTLKEFRVEIRNEALCALGKNGRTGLQIVRYFFRRRFYKPKFLRLLICRKALKSLTETSAPHD